MEENINQIFDENKETHENQIPPVSETEIQENIEKEQNIEYEEMLKLVEDEYNEKYQKEKAALLEEFDEKKRCLEEEFQTKKEELEERFAKRNDVLEAVYNAAQNELEEKYKKKMEEVETFKQESMKEIEQMKKEFEEEKKKQQEELEFNKQEELRKLEKYKDNELKKLKETIDNELARIDELKKKAMEDIEYEKTGFISWKNSEISRIDRERENLNKEMEAEKGKFNEWKASEIEKINNSKEQALREIDIEREDLEKKKAEFVDWKDSEMLKLDRERENVYREISIAKETFELEKEVFRKEVEKQNLAERKIALLQAKRDLIFSDKYILGKGANLIKKHRIITSVISVLLIVAIIFSIVSSVYKTNPKGFLSAVVNNEKTLETVRTKTIIYIEANETPDEIMQQLGNSSLTVITERNNKLDQYYSNYLFTYNGQDFVWERYHKNKTKIMKTPYEPQYIILDNFQDEGFAFEKFSENKIMNDALLQFINYTKPKEIDIREKQRNTGTKFGSLLGYFRSFLPHSDYRYYYRINTAESGQKLLSDLLLKTLASINFNSFLKEEKEIQEKLKFEKNVLDIKPVIESIMKTSEVKNCEAYFVVGKDRILDNADITLTIEYKADEGQIFSFDIHINYSIEQLTEDADLERSIFRINSTTYDMLFPRVKYDEYKEMKSTPVQEQISTVKDMEETGAVFDEIIQVEQDKQEEQNEQKSTTPHLAP